MKRVLYVHNSADIYGASRSLIRLLGCLDRERFDPLIVLPEEGPLAERLRAMGERVIIHHSLSVITRAEFRPHRLPLLLARFPWSVLFLFRLIKRERIDVVHTNTGVIFSSGCAAKLAGAAHVWHIRDWFQEFGRLWKPYARYITGCSDRVLAVSEAIAAQFPDRGKLEVLHNGFELSEFQIDRETARRKFRQTYGIPESVLLVGCVGRIKLIRKGQDMFVRAAGILKQRGVDARYLIVGSPAPGSEDHLQVIRDLIAERDLVDQVIFTGELEDTRPAYAAMDVFVLPSAQPEPFGGVVMEAMAMGVPVVATNIGGSPDQVAEGDTGLLVPPKDPEAMADAIQKLLESSELRAGMSAAGPRRIENHFSLREKAARIQDVYREMIEQA